MPQFSTGYANGALNASGWAEQFPATAVIEERTGAAPGPDAAATGTLIRSYTLAASPWTTPAGKSTSNAGLLSAASVSVSTVTLGHIRIRQAGDGGGASTTAVRVELTAAQWATAVAVSTSQVTSNVATIVTAAAHGLTTGDRVLIAGILVGTAMNGVWTVTVTNSTTFTFAVTTANVTGTASTGTTQRGTAEYNVDNASVAFGQVGNIAIGALVVTHP